MATLETSLEANCDRQTHGQTDRLTKPLIGAQATALPKKIMKETAETVAINVVASRLPER